MKYIRTKDGIYKVWNWWNNSGSIPESDVRITGCYVGNGKNINIEDIIQQADTIEELIQDGDLCHLAECQVCRDQISVVKVFPRKDYIGISVPGIEYGEDSVLELWIKDTNGNYIKVAQKETEEGELELL